MGTTGGRGKEGRERGEERGIKIKKESSPWGSVNLKNSHRNDLLNNRRNLFVPAETFSSSADYDCTSGLKK